MILNGKATALDKVLHGVSRSDAFVEQIMKDFRKITPEVGTSVASLYSEAMERCVRLPKGERRVVGQIALNLSACASLTAALLDEIGDMSGDRHEAAAVAFRALLKEAQENVVRKRLDAIVEGHA